MKPTFILLFSFITIITNAQVYEHISVQQAKDTIEHYAGDSNFVILDIRSPSEFNGGHLDCAININYYDGDFTDQIEALDKSKTYLIHCASGGRSGNAFSQFETLNFERVYNMLGGYSAWSSAGYPNTVCLTEIATANSSTLTVYPNPFNNRINIDGVEIDYIEVYDILGSLVYKAQKSTTIYLNNLPTGYYVLSIKSSKGMFRKVVVKE